GGNRLRRRHLHVRARQRQNELHIDGGRRPRIVVGGEGNRGTGADQLARRRIVAQSEKIVRPRSKGRDGIASGNESHVAIGYKVQVVQRQRCQAEDTFQRRVRQL